MSWIKRGHIFAPDGRYPWSMSHAQVPVVDPIGEGALRIYFGTRDEHNRTRTTFVEVDAEDPRRVRYVHDRPVMELGALGCFDDSGVMPSWLVSRGDEKLLYYIGWNVGQTVPYRNAIGLAVSRDGGRTFQRRFDGPIMDRTATEPQFVACPTVLVEGGTWRMWYLGCTRWIRVDGKAEPLYHLRYATSDDGVSWRRDGTVAIDYKDEDEGGLVRASVLKDGGRYRMWFSRRARSGYRSDPRRSYRIGYAESLDGVRWERMDHAAGIDVSPEGWDSQMLCYPHVYRRGDGLHMVYNGNGFGASGMGWATLAA